MSTMMETMNRLLEIRKDNSMRRENQTYLSDVFEKIYKVYTEYED